MAVNIPAHTLPHAKYFGAESTAETPRRKVAEAENSLSPGEEDRGEADVKRKFKSFFKRSHKAIAALTVQEILDEHIAMKRVSITDPVSKAEKRMGAKPV